VSAAAASVIAINALEPKASTCGPIREFWKASDGSCDLAHLIVLPGHATERHWHERLTEVYLCVRGHGVIEADGHELPLGPREAVTIPPSSHHQLRNATGGEVEIYILAHPQFDPADVHVS
jgi:mannose-6-phosphate isomerase-like protein (cupin superfamily)